MTERGGIPGFRGVIEAVMEVESLGFFIHHMRCVGGTPPSRIYPPSRTGDADAGSLIV